MPDALEPFHYRFVAVLRQPPTETDLREALRQLVIATAMTPFGPEEVRFHDDEWDAVQMIAESHIGLHGHGPRGEGNIWSCKGFDPEAPARALDQALGGMWFYRRVEHPAEEEAS